MNESTSDIKAGLRRDALAVRRKAAADGAAAARALAAFAPILDIPASSVVAGTWPIKDEISPLPLMAALAARGCRLCLPHVGADGLGFRAWALGDPLEDGPHGTRHPPVSAAEMVPDIVLVPLLAFDRRGHRLGYGGGYYDRLFARLRGSARAIGLAFAVQEVVALPAELHDQPLDAILTETGLIRMEGA